MASMVTLALFGLAALIVVLIVARSYQKPIKAVLQDFLRDVRDLVKPLWDRVWCVLRRWWIFLGPRLTNRALWGAALIDSAALFGSGNPGELFLTRPRLMGALVLLNLLTPLTPAGAPTRVPPPLPGGGLVNPLALT